MVDTAHAVYEDHTVHFDHHAFYTTEAEKNDPLLSAPTRYDWVLTDPFDAEEYNHVLGMIRDEPAVNEAHPIHAVRCDEPLPLLTKTSVTDFYPPQPRFKCAECSKDYKNKKTRNVHIKAAHRGRRVSCALGCSKTFRHAASASRHKRKCARLVRPVQG
ncbi:hypothetical protein CYLTODRAFT_491052 [Cylindrobasidium torrendii FP15055 ss-10]|uniref:C2H2-type domain-containing protein n=1 Tax=Cylindrobasidium torrendii FP15055 ss-10 TaxID=1314674 RepID=A0A0D7B9P5_9AGAR|nr:hypothetical protein CYLTODRAFT_491052 [Cylindrobasidium torrendii FP15055 ss-10]